MEVKLHRTFVKNSSTDFIPSTVAGERDLITGLSSILLKQKAGPFLFLCFLYLLVLYFYFLHWGALVENYWSTLLGGWSR